jgi:hypothetical protein
MDKRNKPRDDRFISPVSVKIRVSDMTPDEMKIHRREYYSVNKERIRMLWNVHKEKYKSRYIEARKMLVPTPEERAIKLQKAKMRSLRWRLENPEKVKIIEQRYREKHPYTRKDQKIRQANRFEKMSPLEKCMWGKRVAQQRRESYAKKLKKKGKPYVPQAARGPRFLQTPFYFGKSPGACIPNPNYKRKRKVATDKKLKVSTFCKKTFIMRWE